MASSRQLTGGTGDVSPQILTSPVLNLTAANAFTETRVDLPVNRFPESNGKVVIIEVLKVWFFMSEADSNPIAGGNLTLAAARISTASNTAAIALSDSRTFASQEKNYRGAFTAGGSYYAVSIEPQEINLTDGAGHGVLIATDAIWFGFITTNFTAAGSAFFKMLYRFKRVGLQEYIGILQQQQ